MFNDTNNPMYLDKKVLNIVKTSLANPESEISKMIKKESINTGSGSTGNIEDIASGGKTVILNGGSANE